MYKLETIQKFLGEVKKFREKYQAMDANDIEICISEGNSKIGNALNISTVPIITCGHCKECLWYCYDIKACIRFPKNVLDRRVRNLVILQKDRDLFFRLISEKMDKRTKNKYFRWHQAGEIIDYDYLDRMVKNAKDHPDYFIWTYTKEYDIVNSWVSDHLDEVTYKNGHIMVADNFVIMFSEWRGLAMNNPYNFPVFRVVMVSEGEKLDNETWVCCGDCSVCKKAHRGCFANETVQAKDH